jgi:hypothetical protein
VATTIATDLTPGEFAIDGGFRRVSRGPEPLALARLRELLRDIATTETLRAALEGFGEWRSLAALCGTQWAAGARRSSATTRRVLQRRLRALAAAPISVEEARALPFGSPVHLRGTIRPLVPAVRDGAGSEGGLKTHIWSHSAMNTDNVRFELEVGHDFFLVEEKGAQTACVIAARGHLLDADALQAGDCVSVFGFVDVTAQPTRATPFERGPRSLAVRAGDDVPLILRRLAQDAPDGRRSIL